MPGLVLSPALVAAFIALLFGLIVGSFANVVIYRLPLAQSIAFPSSRCRRRGVAIKPWHSLAGLSWMLLGGRCASCREPISARYPLVEAAHGIGFAMIVLWFFFSSRRRHTRLTCDWSSDVCSSDLRAEEADQGSIHERTRQLVYRAHAMDKVELLTRVLQAADRGLTMIFARTKRTVQRVAEDRKSVV